MSIKEELIRIQDDKERIATNIELKGVKVEDAKIDQLASFLDSCPYVTSGEFTPQYDSTANFTISGLPFKPQYIYMESIELYSSKSNRYIKAVEIIKDKHSKVCYYENDANVVKLYDSSDCIEWYSNGFQLNVWAGFQHSFASRTYKYYILGGFEE